MPRPSLFACVPVVALCLGALPALAALPAFAAQGTPEPDAGIPPVVWQLTRIVDDAGVEAAPPDPARYTVQFLPDGRVLVLADCNRGQGTYQQDGSALTFGPIATTLIGCPPGSLDAVFLQSLADVTFFVYVDDELVLAPEAAGASELAFVPSLVGVVWEWEEFVGGDGSRVAPDDSGRYTLAFDAEGGFRVRADCNRGRGTYRAEGDTLDLTVGPLTRAACPPGSLDRRFLRDIEDATSHVFRDGGLFLALPADAGILAFAARYEDDAATPAAGSGTPPAAEATPEG